MATIIEENIVIKVSRLVRPNSDNKNMVTVETLQALEQVAQELLGDAVVVEAERI